MSDFSTILGRVRSNLLEGGVRYKKASATSNGASDGTSIISTALAEFNDSWNNCVCKVLDGNAAGIKKRVEDFDAATDKLLFTNNAFPRMIVSGVDFELYEPGIWDGDDLKKYIEQAANTYLRIAPDDALLNYRISEDKGGLAGVCDLPTNVIKYVEPIVTINGYPAAIISPERALQFDADPFIPATPNESLIAYFDSRTSAGGNQYGRLKYKPTVNTTCTFHYIPLASFDNDGAWAVPEELWGPIERLTVWFALAGNERMDLANDWFKLMSIEIPEAMDVLKKTRKLNVAA